MKNIFNLLDKNILITGAASGIGRCLAIEASKLGANIILVDINKIGLKDTYEQLIGKSHCIIECNLTNALDRKQLIDNVHELNGVVHCAGIGKTLPFKFCTEDELNKVMSINFFSPVLLTQELLKNNKIKNKSSIVYMASIDGTVTGHIGNSSYSASKGAILGSVRSQALELAGKGIRVNCVSPARVNTPLINRCNISSEQIEVNLKEYPMKRYAEPIEVVGYIIYLLSDVSTYTSGSNLIIDGCYTIN